VLDLEIMDETFVVELLNLKPEIEIDGRPEDAELDLAPTEEDCSRLAFDTITDDFETLFVAEVGVDVLALVIRMTDDFEEIATALDGVLIRSVLNIKDDNIDRLLLCLLKTEERMLSVENSMLDAFDGVRECGKTLLGLELLYTDETGVNEEDFDDATIVGLERATLEV